MALPILYVGTRSSPSGAAIAAAEDRNATSLPAKKTFPEAPAGFDDAGNGFDETFKDDRDAFEDVETICPELACKPTTMSASLGKRRRRIAVTNTATMPCTTQATNGGLGPIYNERACANCHQNPISGSSSQIAEIRAGFLIRSRVGTPGIPATLDFAEPTFGSLIHQRAINSRIQEHVPESDPTVAATQPGEPAPKLVHTLRMTTNILGDGFVEALSDQQIVEYQDQQRDQQDKGLGDMRGLAICVRTAVFDEKEKKIVFGVRIGRFGWKCQEASLLNFSAGAYINEMGITSPLHPNENPSNANLADPNFVKQFDPVKDPEDAPATEPATRPSDQPFGEDVEAFTRFMRATKVPPTQPSTAAIERGRQLFGTNTTDEKSHRTKIENSGIGCVICHRAEFLTPAPNFRIFSVGREQSGELATDLPNGEVGPFLGNKYIHPYSDFMLHDIGTRDGIVQTQFAQNPPAGAENVEKALLKAGRPNSFIEKLTKDRDKPAGFVSGLDDYRMIYIERSNVKDGPAGTTPRRLTEKRFVAPDEDAPLDQRTRNKVRTAPLWGLRVRPQLLHDGSALTINEAIQAHRGEAQKVTDRYNALLENEKQDLLAFLNSLGFDNRDGEGPPHVKPQQIDPDCPRNKHQ
jgi:CxxC motif-containing protein (DUF1111 family)